MDGLGNSVNGRLFLKILVPQTVEFNKGKFIAVIVFIQPSARH